MMTAALRSYFHEDLNAFALPEMEWQQVERCKRVLLVARTPNEEVLLVLIHDKLKIRAANDLSRPDWRLSRII